MTTPDAAVCQEFVELVTDYLEDALLIDERQRLERHLAECDGCTTYLDQMRQTISATSKLGPDAIPPEGLDRLIAMYRRFRSG